MKAANVLLTENRLRFTIRTDNFEKLGGLRLFEIDGFSSNTEPKSSGQFFNYRGPSFWVPRILLPKNKQRINLEVQTTSMGPVILGVIIAIVITAFVSFPLRLQSLQRVTAKDISSPYEQA